MSETDSTQHQPESPTPASNHEPAPPPLSARAHLQIVIVLLSVLAALAIIYSLYFAAAMLLPIVVAILLNFLFSPLVRAMASRGIPRVVTAVLIVAALLACVLAGAFRFSTPVMEFATEAPNTLRALEWKLRGVVEPIEKVAETAEAVEKAATGESDPAERPVVLKGPTFVSTGLRYARNLGAGGIVAVVLLLFLLSADDLFLHKLVEVMPRFKDKREAVLTMRGIERDVSHYLITITLINTGLGATVGIVLWTLGLPNALLWALVVGILNFIPYFGAMVSVALIAVAGLIAFDSLFRAMLPPLAFAGINLMEAYLVTPLIVGRRLRMNPVSVLLSLVFWTWLWGIPGAILSVPILVLIKGIASHIRPLHPLAQFLDSADANGSARDLPAPLPRRVIIVEQ